MDGKFTATFTIPADIPCGGRVVKVDSPSGLVTADNIFYGLGIVNHITEYKEIAGIKYVIHLTLYSPLAESFVVTEEVFLSSVDVWVYRVPTGDQGGLKVAIRGMSDDGQPNNIVYGSAFLSQAQIMDAMGISDVNDPMQDDPDDTNKCTFTFSSLVYLKPGSYCFTIEDQAPGYYVYTATLGQTILGKVGESGYSQIGNLLKIQPFGGVMFISANNQSWELKQGTDILFRIKRASFNTAVTGIVQNTLGAPTVSKSHFAHITSFGNPADCDIYSVFVKKTMRANSFIFLYRA